MLLENLGFTACLHQHGNTGSDREETAKDVIVNFGGSAAAYVNNLSASGVNGFPSEQVIRICEFNKKDLLSSNWLTNLLVSADHAKEAYKSKKKEKYGDEEDYLNYDDDSDDENDTFLNDNNINTENVLQKKLIKS
ncbi:unnamed protein product, partial [Brachionus calyciflorus]